MKRFATIASLAAVFTIALGSMQSHAADVPGLSPGPVELQSIGPMTFAGNGVLLVGDPQAATVYAIAIDADSSASPDRSMKIANLKQAIAQAIGADAANTTVGDLAVDSDTGAIVVSAQSNEKVYLLLVLAGSRLKVINLDKIDHARKGLPNPPADKVTGEGRRRKNLRMESITDIAFFDGKVLVSGVSADQSPSGVMEFSFPFSDNSVVTNVEIFHAAHGRVEEPAIRTFIPITIGGEPTLLAGFTCTPLVRFPIDSLDGKETVRGTTVAELGNRNVPIDLISYEKGGKASLLMSNTVRGVMKISTEDIQDSPGLTEKVSGGGTAGQSFQKIEQLEGVTQMDKLSDELAVVIQGKSDETQTLMVVDLP